MTLLLLGPHELNLGRRRRVLKAPKDLKDLQDLQDHQDQQDLRDPQDQINTHRLQALAPTDSLLSLRTTIMDHPAHGGEEGRLDHLGTCPTLPHPAGILLVRASRQGPEALDHGVRPHSLPALAALLGPRVHQIDVGPRPMDRRIPKVPLL
jgi:hypothetical protein